jgi:hypothetical protein
MSKTYITTVNILNKIRSLNENKKNITESFNDSSNAIAITDDPKFGDSVLSNQINQFRTSVESSAQFSKANAENPAESPLIYIPNEKNIVFTGTIPTLNNLKWQFVLNSTSNNGCFVWTDENLPTENSHLSLNKDTLVILNKLQGFYKNWCEQWRQSAKELEQLGNADN